MGKKTLSEEIEARLDRQNDLSGYDSHVNAESTMNTVKNEINSKMMNGEELTEDDIKAINMINEAYGIDPESLTRDYLEGMEAQGYDIEGLQNKINSTTGANNNVGASRGDIEVDGGFEERTGKSIAEAIDIINNSTNDPLRRLKHLAEYTLNNSGIFQNDKKSLKIINKEAKAIKKDLKQRKQPIPEAFNEFFYFLKYGRLPKDSGYTPPTPRPRQQQQVPQAQQQVPQAQQQVKREHQTPIGIIIKNLKKAVKLGKKAEGAKLEELRGKIDTLLKSIDYSILQAEEIHELLQLEEPIYKIFGLKISDYRDGFFNSQRGTGYEQGLKSIRTNNAHLQPKDIIEQISGAEIGSPEYMHTKEMISELQDINSTERINKNLKYLAMFGIAGMVLSFAIGIMGFHYDIIYHFPFMETVLPSWVIWIFAIFGTGLIMALPMDSLVNRKYMSVSRKLLAILLLFGLPLKVYIDYKAIVNYSNQVAEAKRQDSLKDKTKVIGSSFSNIERAKSNQEKTIERIGKQLETYNKQLAEISELRKPHQKFIDKFSKMSWTQWRSDNIAKHQKELRKLDRREASIQNHINMLQHQQEQYMGVLTKNTEKLNSLLSQSEQQAKEEADNRFKMMSAMLFLIELASMLKIYSEFIRNKNTPITLDVLNRINTFLDAGETIDAMGYKLSETINRANMAKGQHIQEVINHQIYG